MFYGVLHLWVGEGSDLRSSCGFWKHKELIPGWSNYTDTHKPVVMLTLNYWAQRRKATTYWRL